MKVDMLVEGTDVPRGMSYREAARKAVAACVSDFASKGARPDSFLVSLGIRKGTTQRQVEELSAGLRDAEKEWKVTLVGGDTNEAKELVVDCAMFGFANRIVARSGARVGDALVVSGEFGLPPAGLKILTAGAKAERRFREKAVRSVLHPSPNLEAGVALGGYLSSGMDSSDGFAKSIHALARESGVGFEVRELPAGFGVKKFAKDNGLDWEKLVLAGG
ncbi:MAG: thiamine-monophosphate kinase, partial [Thaumarchaeota archaeon]|nr:thiamine-monophosphate kinase [Nitrososphaerota archaeon]